MLYEVITNMGIMVVDVNFLPARPPEEVKSYNFV